MPRLLTNPRRARLLDLYAEFASIWLFESTRLIELILAGFPLFWGVWAILNPDKFDLSPAYEYLSQWFTGPVWGTFASIIGFLRIAGAVTKVMPMRIVAAIADTYLWGMITLGVLIADAGSGGVYVFGWHDAVCFFTIVRLISWGGRGWRSVPPKP